MKKRKIFRVLRFDAIVLLLVSFFLLAGCGRKEFVPIESSTLNEIGLNSSDDDNSSFSENLWGTMTTEEVIKAKKLRQFKRNRANVSVMKESDIKNILIVGQDRRYGDKEEMRSDAMMIFSINTITNQINLISLMRDMYIPCADGKEGMINLTYLNGGAALLSQTIEMNFGVHIDGYIEVDFWRFMNLFDLIGPVSISLSDQEASVINEMSVRARKEYSEDPKLDDIQKLTTGENNICSEQLLNYCRARQNLGGDWGRTDRQRNVIITTYNMINNMSYAGLIRLVKEGAKYLNTDMNIADMLGYFYWLKKNDITQINGYRLPLEGTYTQEIREEVLNVLVPQIEPNKNAMQQYIYGGVNNES